MLIVNILMFCNFKIGVFCGSASVVHFSLVSQFFGHFPSIVSNFLLDTRHSI